MSSSLEPLPPAPSLQSWAFSGHRNSSLTRPPVPEHPQVVQVGLCTTRTSPLQDMSALIQAPVSSWKHGVPPQPYAAQDCQKLSQASACTLLSQQEQADNMGAQQTGVQSTSACQGAAADKAVSSRPGSSRSATALGSQGQVSEQPPGAGTVKAGHKHLMTAILPSTEDGKLHSLVSHLRAALSEQASATQDLQSQASTRPFHHVLCQLGSRVCTRWLLACKFECTPSVRGKPLPSAKVRHLT